MKPLLTLVAISGLTLGTAALSSSVLAQTPDPDQPPAAMAGSPPVDTGTAPPPASVTASRPVPDTAATSPGIPGPASVNPAPGAAGPYVGHGPHAFYDVDQRITDVTQRSAALPTAQRRDAEAQLKAIRAEEATQKQRHGELRDWDRENLNYKLDQLAQKYPSLAGPNAQAAASNP